VIAPSFAAAFCTSGECLRLGAQTHPQVGASHHGIHEGVQLSITCGSVAAYALARLVLSGACTPIGGAALDFSDSLGYLGEAGPPGPPLVRLAIRVGVTPIRKVRALFGRFTAVFEPGLSFFSTDLGLRRNSGRTFIYV